ncbi:MAG: hypothetical protein P4L53_20870 [Candidatus Obscuribacterales bacterium]|nr:hypothetical protein [Candidatus Obscuribacterales bacterium]
MSLDSEISDANIADRLSLHMPIILLPPSGAAVDFSEGHPAGIHHSPENYQELLNRMAKVLLSADFFVKTKLKGFALWLEVSNFWDPGTEVRLKVFEGRLWGMRKIYLADFWQMTPSEFLDFQTGVAAEIIIAACKKYKLDDSAAKLLANNYPLRKIEFSLINFEPTLSLIDPPLAPHFHPLTNEELAFEDFNQYQWCVSQPFTADQLQKIGPETLTVFAPVDLPVDQYVQIANAMQRAPLATLRISGWHNGNDLRFLKHFCNLSRLCIDIDQLVDLTCLRSLSKDLIHLELHFRSKVVKPSLDALEHFNSLQSLRLGGHYEDLSRFSKLSSLKALMLSDVSVKDLSSLSSLPSLQSFVIADSKVTDVAAISTLSGLKYLGLARLPKLVSMPDVSELQHLEYLNLIGLTKLERLSSLINSKKLRRLSLSGLKCLANLAEVSDAENLEELLIFNMKNLTPASLSWIEKHRMLKAFRTDDIALEKAVGLKRGNTGKVFEFSKSDLSVVDRALQAQSKKFADLSELKFKNGAASVTAPETEEQDEEAIEEIRVHIKLGGEFGDSDEYLKCNEIEDLLEQILESEYLGRWAGHEIGAGFFDISFVGEDGKLMLEALNVTLREVLPNGSYVELEDRNQSVAVTQY